MGPMKWDELDSTAQLYKEVSKKVSPNPAQINFLIKGLVERLDTTVSTVCGKYLRINVLGLDTRLPGGRTLVAQTWTSLRLPFCRDAVWKLDGVGPIDNRPSTD